MIGGIFLFPFHLVPFRSVFPVSALGMGVVMGLFGVEMGGIFPFCSISFHFSRFLGRFGLGGDFYSVAFCRVLGRRGGGGILGY